VINKHCPLDLRDSAFAPGTCAQSVFGQVNALLYRHLAGDAFTLMNGEELASLHSIERFMGQKIPRLKLEGFPYLYTALFEPESATGGKRAIGGGRTHRGYSFGRRRR